jgi:hypothetical protein
MPTNPYLKLITEISFENKYTKWYVNILHTALERASTKTEAKHLLDYVEGHHIVPKSFKMGGEKDKLNIAYLTAREHFVVHMLLPKMIKDKYLACKITCALTKLMKDENFNSRRYETARKIFTRRYNELELTIYYVIDENDNKIKITNMPQFCKENDLSVGDMISLAHGKRKQYKGFKRLNWDEPVFTKYYNAQCYYNCEKITIENVAEFCKENNLFHNTFTKMLSGEYRYCKEYYNVDFYESICNKKFEFYLDNIKTETNDIFKFCKDNNLNVLKMVDLCDGKIKHHKNCKSYTKRMSFEFIDPNGNKVITADLPKYCKENNLDERSMYRVYYGERKYHKGYKNINNPDYMPQGTKEYIFYINNEKIIIVNMNKFCIENNLDIRGLSAVNTGKKKSYMGYTKYAN